MADGLHWISLTAAGRLSTMAAPPSGDRLLPSLRRLASAGVTGVVSLLEDGLAGEAEACASTGLAFRSFPMPDFGLPYDEAAFWSLANTLAAELRAGASIAVHCQAGIGRSSLVAAAVLTRFGQAPDEVFSTISMARGHPVPDTEAQRDWLVDSARRQGTGC